MASTDMPSAVAAPTGAAVHDSYDVLILDAASRQSLTTARRLGRAGLRVALADCAADCGPSWSALSFYSRYSARNVVLPSVSTDPDDFADAVVAFARAHPTRVILPTADAGIAALMPRRAELAALGTRLALAPDAALRIASDKDRTLSVARELGIDCPQTVKIEGLWDLPEAIGTLGFPCVLKPTVSVTRQSFGRLYAVEVVNEVEAIKVVQAYLSAGADVLAQQWASGLREGVTLFIAGGEVRAACAPVAYRTSPALGGASVLRESVPLRADVRSAAVRLATAIGLEGVCEVEFRRNAAGRPLLMEVNARLAGWRCAVWFSPGAFRRLPAAIRVTKARTVLGPSGSWWLRDRIEGVVETAYGQQVRGAEPAGSGVRLHLEGRHPEGRPLDGPAATMLDVDHVIAGTGFRIDLDRLGFLSERLRGQIVTLNRYPVLSRAGQSSVPGLYFAGAPAAVSLGPSERFIGGTHNSVRPLTRAIARQARVSVTDVTQTPHSVPPRHVPA